MTYTTEQLKELLCANTTLVDLAPHLASEVIRLREALHKIASRNGAPIRDEAGYYAIVARKALSATSEK